MQMRGPICCAAINSNDSMLIQIHRDADEKLFIRRIRAAQRNNIDFVNFEILFAGKNEALFHL